MNKNINADKMKTVLWNKLLFDWKRLSVMTEYRNADVHSIKTSMFSEEFEIKVSRQDLLNEGKAIYAATHDWRDPGIKKYSVSKRFQHESYLGTRKIDGYGLQKPNEYSFFVPEYLESLALDITASLPYGVLVFNKTINNPPGFIAKTRIDQFYWSKKPKKLHDNKIDTMEIKKLMRKISTESYFTREKLINKTTL